MEPLFVSCLLFWSKDEAFNHFSIYKLEFIRLITELKYVPILIQPPSHRK